MYQGFYINLARNEARRRALVQHLTERGASGRYQRIEAVDGHAVADQYSTELDPGNLGLYLSHARVLEAARGASRHVHIIEDDTILAKGAVNRLDSILGQADAQVPEWDLIFTDIYVPTWDVWLFQTLAEKIEKFARDGAGAFVDLQPIHFACTSSFLINWRSLGKYADLISQQWSLGPPIDLHLRHLVSERSLIAYLTVPFQTSVSSMALESDIRGELDRSRVIENIYRRAFFQDADLQSLQVEMEQLTASAKLSTLADIFIRALVFRLGENWTNY